MSVAELTKFTEVGLPLRAGSQLRESEGGGQRREVVIISEGWGSSGYYSSEVLKRDIPRIFPVGTHMYLNHQTEREAMERPERDVSHLVGKIIETPRLAGIEMVAVAEIYQHWVEFIEAMASDIGLSIVAYGLSEEGSAGGRQGTIITGLTEGFSVDYVTRAGAGGKVGQLLESAEQRSIKIHEELASDLSQQLRNAGRERWATKSTYVYVDDYDVDENWVVFCISPDYEDSSYVKISFARTGDDVELTGSPETVERTTSYTPVRARESDGPGSGDRKPKKKEEAKMAEISDQELAELRESVKSVQARQDAADKKVEEAEGREKAANERAARAEDALLMNRAATVAAEALKDEKYKTLPGSAKARAVEAALTGDLPTQEVDGVKRLDESALKERVRGKAEEEANYLAEAGVSQVEGFGAPVSESGVNGGGPSDAGTKAVESLTQRFEESGMSKEAAKAAAEGR